MGKRTWLFLAVLALAALLLAGCGGQPSPEGASPSGRTAAKAPATVSLVGGRFLHYRTPDDSLGYGLSGVIDLAGIVAVREVGGGGTSFVTRGDSFDVYGLPYSQAAELYEQFEGSLSDGTAAAIP